MATVRVFLLAVAVVGVLVRPPPFPSWFAPAAMLGVGLGVGAVEVAAVGDALGPLSEPLGFLLLAVPLAVLLDGLGFFAAVAARIDHSRYLHLGLWFFAAAVTTVLNLDASVVLLTPLYVRIARRHGLDPLAAAFTPMLLACFASSALPVSNLTNLLAAERFDLGAVDFALRLGPASFVAVVVGYHAHRRVFPEADPRATATEAVDPRALRLGTPVVLLVLVGFTVGDAWGLPAWVVAAIADVVLVAMVRRVPWREVPFGAAGLAGALGVLAAVTAQDLGVERIVGGPGDASTVELFAGSVLGANALNNLPALLVALPALDGAPEPRLWAVLLGLNMGPVLVVSGSLAGLLWLDAVRRLDVAVDVGTYTRVGLRVGLPALAAGFVTLLITNAVVR